MVTLRRFSAVDLVPAYVLGGVVTATLCFGLAGGVTIGLRDALLILVMGSIQLALPAVLLLRGARDVPAVHMAILTMLDVVMSPLWVWLALGEGLTPLAIGGGLSDHHRRGRQRRPTRQGGGGRLSRPMGVADGEARGLGDPRVAEPWPRLRSISARYRRPRWGRGPTRP